MYNACILVLGTRPVFVTVVANRLSLNSLRLHGIIWILAIGL